MDLSIREVATLMGCSERTVRSRLSRGELSGVKRDGQWRVNRDSVPLTVAQQKALQEKADTIRQTVEDALPPRLARSAKDRLRSVADLDIFRASVEVLSALRTDDAVPARAAELLEEGVLALAEGHHLFAPADKHRSLQQARASIARGVGVLLSQGIERHRAHVQRLEGDVLPGIAGLSRAIERRVRR